MGHKDEPRELQARRVMAWAALSFPSKNRKEYLVEIEADLDVQLTHPTIPVADRSNTHHSSKRGISMKSACNRFIRRWSPNKTLFMKTVCMRTMTARSSQITSKTQCSGLLSRWGLSKTSRKCTVVWARKLALDTWTHIHTTLDKANTIIIIIRQLSTTGRDQTSTTLRAALYSARITKTSHQIDQVQPTASPSKSSWLHMVNSLLKRLLKDQTFYPKWVLKKNKEQYCKLNEFLKTSQPSRLIIRWMIFQDNSITDWMMMPWQSQASEVAYLQTTSTSLSHLNFKSVVNKSYHLTYCRPFTTENKKQHKKATDTWATRSPLLQLWLTISSTSPSTKPCTSGMPRRLSASHQKRSHRMSFHNRSNRFVMLKTTKADSDLTFASPQALTYTWWRSRQWRRTWKQVLKTWVGNSTIWR